MAYYATRTLKVKNKHGEYEFRNAGDHIPEAKGWEPRILEATVNAGHLVLKLDEDSADEEVKEVKSDIMEDDEPVEATVTKKRRGRPRRKKV